jgi:tRNA modification GTPase
MDFFIDNIRYIDIMKRTKESLEKILNNLDVPLEFTASDLKDASQGLSEIIGEIYHEDILEKIFSSFCIGK